MSRTQLAGKSAVVTGGSRGIGLAVASMLSADGVDVLICGRSSEALSDAVDKLSNAASNDHPRGRVQSIQADVRDPSQMEAVMARAAETFGGMDILVNNAGVGRFRELAELSVEDWRTVIETNLSGVFFACRAAIPLLRGRGGGWIINMSSLAGSHAFAGGAAYCAAKAGLDALTTSLMQELRYDDIRVSCVAPGSVDTRFGDQGEVPAAPWKLDATDVAQVVIDLLRHDPRSLPSRVELRPSRPRK